MAGIYNTIKNQSSGHQDQKSMPDLIRSFPETSEDPWLYILIILLKNNRLHNWFVFLVSFLFFCDDVILWVNF